MGGESVAAAVYIESVFDSVWEGDPAALLQAASETQRELIEREGRILELAAGWADCHPGEASDVPGPARRLGGDGTPTVGWSCVAEFGSVLQTTTGAAEMLIGDALDLRHRLPRLWRLVIGGGVRAWKARKVAQATRQLPPEAAAAVDAAITSVIISVPWSRFERFLEAAVMAADPEDAEARARAFEAERFVRAGRSVAGLKTLVARAQAGEVIWFMAMVNRIAEILASDGDPDPIDVRRSKAIGILANPALALQLLADHTETDSNETDPNETDPNETDPSEAEPDDAGGAEEPHRSVSVDPPAVHPRRLQPTVVLYVHLSDDAVRTGRGVSRMEQVGPVTIEQLRRFLASTDCRIRVQPVLDTSAVPAVDRYEVPARMREALRTRNPVDVFPWGVCTSRTMDADHTVAYLAPDRGGPPGQTELGNLGWLTRSHHRLKTLAGWTLRQPEPGVYLWRSPHGWCYLVNATGTHELGNGPLARTVWTAARSLSTVRTPAA